MVMGQSHGIKAGWRIAVVGLVVWAATVSPAAAQRVYIDITKPSFARLPIAVPYFKREGTLRPELSRKMAERLAADLDFSGIFRPLDPRGFLGDPQSLGMAGKEINFPQWRRMGADFLVRGRYRIQGRDISLEMRLFDVVTARMLVGKIYQGAVEEYPAMIHRFGDEILRVLTGEAGVFQTKIAFVQQEKGRKEIYLMDFDGSHVTPVTANGSVNLSPAWNPAGTQIAYVSYVEGPTKIFVKDLVSSRTRLLCSFPGLNIAPAWRPGTGQLAVTLSMNQNPDIYLIRGDGTVLRPLVKSWAIEVSPSWSPDGRRMAYVSSETGGPQIYILDVDSGRKQRLTYQGDYNTDPAWSPKGDWIAYTGRHQGQLDIYLIRPDGSSVRRLTQGPGSSEAPSWSPDGRLIAFSSTRQQHSAIWVAMMNGTGLRRLTFMDGEQRMPAWSPRLKR